MSTDTDDNQATTTNSAMDNAETEATTNQTTGSTKQSDDNSRVVFILKPVGNAPILKKRKWALPRTRTMSYIVEFLKKFIQPDATENQQIVLYVNQAFSPALDTTLGAVYDCFSSEGTVILHYALTQAWG